MRSERKDFKEIKIDALELMNNFCAESFKSFICFANAESKNKKDLKYYVMLPEYIHRRTKFKPNHLVISLFEREIWTKILYLNHKKLKKHDHKFTLENLDKITSKILDLF